MKKLLITLSGFCFGIANASSYDLENLAIKNTTGKDLILYIKSIDTANEKEVSYKNQVLYKQGTIGLAAYNDSGDILLVTACKIDQVEDPNKCASFQFSINAEEGLIYKDKLYSQLLKTKYIYYYSGINPGTDTVRVKPELQDITSIEYNPREDKMAIWAYLTFS